MISILIPIYNFQVASLVKDLLQQAESAEVPFEIRCYDDGSVPSVKEVNRPLQHLPGVVYKELPLNLGRSKIRNLLANEAKYEYLLFMDCDSKVVKADYIKCYLDKISSDAVISGGRIYKSIAPSDPALKLHWAFGKHREEIPAEQRALDPYRSFMTNNYLIPKSIALDTPFEEQLNQYGHEDTLFGMHLKEKGVPIMHIDNPLEHIGLEQHSIFLEKTKKSIENLWLLYRQGQPLETKLLDTYLTLHQFGLKTLARKTLYFLHPRILDNLMSEYPRLLFLDLYKLKTLLEVAKV